MTDSECLFCRIIAKSVPAQIVGEAPGLLAIKDIHPQAPTHLLLLPKEHIRTLADASQDQTPILGQALQFANQLARSFKLVSSGYRVVVNCGEGAGQSVWHLHFHLLGGRPLQWPPG